MIFICFNIIMLMHHKTSYIMLKQIGGNSIYIDFITKKTDNIRLNINDEEKITAILNKYIDNLKTLICLDFHGVTDLFNDNEKIPTHLPKCVISYIGGSPKTILETTKTIRKRILSNEVLLGIIVYKKNSFPTPGTKGWIISKISSIYTNMKIHFIDDSRKNIECVDNIKSDKITTYYINNRKNPKKYLSKIINKL